LADLLEWIWERAAWDSTAKADARPECLHHGAIETVGDGFEAHVLSVQRLHLVLLEWLYFDDIFGGVISMRNVLGHMGSIVIDDVST
jgi:hypothetical protein